MKRIFKPIMLAATAAALAAVPACAQTATAPAPSAAQSPPPPPCQDAVFKQFDFWVGAWDVANAANGKPAGTNSITKEEYGCLLVERWVNTAGITGQSYNFVDLQSGKWRQVWVSGGATIDYAGGLDDKGAMVLEGTIGYGAGQPGNGAKFRGTWTPNPDGTVSQHFQQYDDAKREWTDWFVGTYTRKAP